MSKVSENSTEEERLLKAYTAKLKREAFLKAAVLGLIAGFVLSAVVAVVSFATQKNFLWIALAVWAAVSVGVTLVLYFTLYRTGLNKTAARVDGMGLDERVVTMVEFMGDDSVIAQKQRQDTHTVLQSVSAKQLKTGVSKLFLILLAALALISVFMMSYSTVLAVQAQETAGEEQQLPEEEEELSDEDKIIRGMIQNLRDIIDEAEIDDALRGYLHSLVDDLEASLKPEDSLQVKIAKISETAQKIHKLIEEYLSRSTIAEELKKYDTTRELGEAIESEDIEKIAAAFQKMYDSIAPLVEQEKFELILRTALDIDQALKDARNTPPTLQKALEDLRDALLAVIPKLPDGEEPKSNDEINQELQDAFEQAKDAIEDYFDEQQQAKDTDDALQDEIKDALEQLGQDTSQMLPEADEREAQLPQEGEQEGENDGSETGPSHPAEDGDLIYDSVIDGETSYKDVYDDYYEKVKELLERDDLTDEERELLENYFDLLK